MLTSPPVLFVVNNAPEFLIGLIRIFYIALRPFPVLVGIAAGLLPLLILPLLVHILILLIALLGLLLFVFLIVHTTSF
jgi:hypothetical protein